MSKIFSPVSYKNLPASNEEPVAKSASWDFEKIVTDVAQLQMATEHIMPMVRENIKKGWKQIPNVNAARSPKSWFVDPLSLQYSLGYKDKRFSLTYDTLKRMSGQVAIVSAIINTRAAQVAAFAQPYRTTRSLGYIIRHKDSDHRTTTSEVEFIKELEAFIQNCGRSEKNPYSMQERDDLEGFLRKIIRDSLVLDAACAEIIPDSMGIPYEFYAIDASTIRYAADSRGNPVASSYHDRTGFVPSMPGRFQGLYDNKEYGDTDLRTANGQPIKYVQVVQGQIENVFSDSELIFGVRNPRPDLYICNYGMAELEQLISVVTGLLYAESYNMNFFKQGSTPHGILNFRGDYLDETQLQDFQRNWQANVSGVENSWRLPITQSEGLEWVDFRKTNQDMQFHEWHELLVKLTCFKTATSYSENGCKPIQEIKPGERVFTHCGELKKVLNTQKRHYKGNIISIKAGGELLEVTDEHPFLVANWKFDYKIRRKVFNTEPKWVLAGNLDPENDYLVVPKKTYANTHTNSEINLSKYVDYDLIESDGLIKSGKKFAHAASFIQKTIELTDENAFALGLYVAEGNTTDHQMVFTFNVEESDLVEEIVKFADRMGINSNIRHNTESVSNVILSHKILTEVVGELFGHTAKLKKIPSEIMQATSSAKRAFISGLLSGDGSVPKFKSGGLTTTISSASKLLIDQVRTLLFEQGIFSYQYNGISNSSGFGAADSVLYRLDINGTFSAKLAEWFSGPKGTQLRDRMKTRKQIKTTIYESDEYFYVPIKDMWNDYYDGFVYNLEVEDHHTYQVNRFAVHNCAVYLIDPNELGFPVMGGVSQTPLFESSQEWKLKASRDRGLKPLLKFIAKLLNKNIIDRIDDHFTLEFIGLDEMSEQDKHNMLAEQIASYMTLNEARRQLDLPDLPEGDVPMNPTYLEVLKMKQEQKNTEQQMQMQAQQPQEQPQQEEAPPAQLPGTAETSPEAPQYSDNWMFDQDRGQA